MQQSPSWKATMALHNHLPHSVSAMQQTARSTGGKTGRSGLSVMGLKFSPHCREQES